MDLNSKKDEHFIDGKDKWHVHYITDDDTKINPGDYKEIIQISKNGDMVGQAIWRKDKTGKDKFEPWREGIQEVPATAKKVDK
ncbi:MAG: hypothetical protein ABI947_02220 [Chloroflexota bacterium]